MGEKIEVKVPDIGDFNEVEVIEVLVKAGDRVEPEQSLITVESDKASMEIPSSAGGVVTAVHLKLGDKVSQGTPIVDLEAQGGAAAPASQPEAAAAVAPAPAQRSDSAAAGAPAPASAPAATPAPAGAAAPAGAGAGAGAGAAAPGAAPTASVVAPSQPPPARTHPVPQELHGEEIVVKPHASPSVRKFARELGVDIALVRGSGPKQRITHEDVRLYVKQAVARATGAEAVAGPAPSGDGAALGLIPWPQVDFAKFGPVERQPRSRIRKLSAANLHRNWVMIPHVTNHEDADITDLEQFRVQLNKEHEKAGIKVTMLAFLIKACVAALKKFPEFNASLDGDELVLKHYYHIGFAADTPNGLVVPVLRDADRKGVLEIAQETAALAKKARDGKMAPSDMQGGTFSISSLGGIGGTYFTPIINAPEVAILGVCRSAMRPVWDGKQFAPRLVLPLSLSWDHRVIDGASAARFNATLAQLLADFRRAML